MKDFVIRFAINIIALLAVIYAAGGVSADSVQAIIVASLVLGLLNAFLKPVILLLTLPLNMLTLGLFTLFVNAFTFYLTSKFVKGFHVACFWSAFWAAILFSIISFALNLLLSPGANIKSWSRRRYYSARHDEAIDVEGHVDEEKDQKGDNDG